MLVLRGHEGRFLAKSFFLSREEGFPMKKLSFVYSAIFFAAFLCLCNVAIAGDGVDDNNILIGAGDWMGGITADSCDVGLDLFIRHINGQGGIHGRKLQFRGYPVRGGAKYAFENVRRLLEEDRVFCIFNFGGVQLAAMLAPYVTEKKIPFLFPHQGSDVISGKRYVFTSYPFYKGEGDIILKYLAQNRGSKKIGIIYADNAYGHIFRDKLRENSSRFGYGITGEQPLKELSPVDLIREMSELKKLQPDALIMAIYPDQALRALEARGKLGWKDITLVSTGPLADEKYLNVPGGYAEGTIALSLYPDPELSQEPGIVEYREIMKKYYPEKQPNRLIMYGYVFGKLIAEGIRRAGRELTRENFIEAMESIKNWESGGIMPPISFSKTDHHAQTAGVIAELKGGRFRPITSWIDVE